MYSNFRNYAPPSFLPQICPPFFWGQFSQNSMVGDAWLKASLVLQHSLYYPLKNWALLVPKYGRAVKSIYSYNLFSSFATKKWHFYRKYAPPPDTAWLQSIWGSSSKQANFVIKNIFPYAHICQHKLEDKCFRLILCYWKCEADVSSPSGCALAAVVLNWILDTQLWGEWAKLTQMFLLNIFALFNLIIIVSQCKASMGGEGQKLGLVYCNIYEKSKNGCFQSHPPCKTAK